MADPRLEGTRFSQVYRITPWNQTVGAVTSANAGTAAAVADPRPSGPYNGAGKYYISSFDEPARTVIAASTTGHGAFSVADPRTHWPDNTHASKLAVKPWDKLIGTVTGSDRVGSGAYSVADPRPAAFRDGRPAYQSAGRYGVTTWDEPSNTVIGSGRHDNGAFSIADPREAIGEALPAPEAHLYAVIRALDGTWHRPFTTLELAALQGLVDPEEETLKLDGKADAAWRERIGNAVPPPAAKAIASVMGRTLLLAWAGESFMLSSEPIWVQPIATALAVRQSADMD